MGLEVGYWEPDLGDLVFGDVSCGAEVLDGSERYILMFNDVRNYSYQKSRGPVNCKRPSQLA